MTEIRLRDATPEDRETLWRFLAALQEFERESDPNRIPGPDMAVLHLEALEDWVGQHYAGGNVIAEIDGRPAGWALFAVAQVHGFMVPEAYRLIGQLSDLWVEPEFRGAGVASALVQEAERRFRAAGIKRLHITAIASNARAIGLYQSLGYAPFEVALGKSL
ncbi:MAG: GNAT family N-acetyltransferase [Pseudomonadota bacterium]